MSYDYFLTCLKSPHISSLRQFNSADCVIDFLYSMDETKEKLNELYPSAQDQWEYNETDYKGDNNPYFCGQVLDMPGRFEFILSLHPVPHLSIKGSHHINQREEVIKVARALRLSAFDVQTGERIYLQDT